MATTAGSVPKGPLTGRLPPLAAALAATPHAPLSGERLGGLPAALGRALAALLGRPPLPAPPRAAVAIVLRWAAPPSAALSASQAGAAGAVTPPPAASPPPVAEWRLADVEVLLIQRTARAGDAWSGHLAFPGGRVEAGEDDEAAAAREAAEEVGLDLRTGPWVRLGRLDDAAVVPRRSSRSPAVLAAVVWAHTGGGGQPHPAPPAVCGRGGRDSLAAPPVAAGAGGSRAGRAARPPAASAATAAVGGVGYRGGASGAGILGGGCPSGKLSSRAQGRRL